MDLELNERQREVQHLARAYAREVLAPTARERAQRHAIPLEVIRGLGERGLLGVNIPASFGGAEAGVVSYALALREIAAVDASVAVTMAVTNMVSEVLRKFGTEEQAQRYIPPLVRGEVLGGAFGLSEPTAGSDAASLRTKAVPEAGGGWRISGEKMWITTGDAAGVIVLWARSEEAPGHRGISCFLVPGDAPGLSAGKPEDKMGLWASHTVPLSLSEVPVAADHMLGQPGEGFRIAMTALDGGRVGIGAQALGMGYRALEEARAFLRGGRPDQSQQFELADMATELDAAWLMVLRAAWCKESGRPFSQEAAMAKVIATETANRVIRRALHILGPEGYHGEAVVARLLRDCRVTQIYEGTSEIQRVVIARQILRG